MRGFKSERAYMERLADLDNHTFDPRRAPTLDTFDKMIIGYFIEKREETVITKDGTTTRRYFGTVSRSWFSIFKKLYKHCGLGNLGTNCPLIKEKCKQWENQAEVDKAATFSKEDLHVLYNAALDKNASAFVLCRAAYAVTALSMAARGCESTYLTHEHISEIVDRGNPIIKISGWYRGKDLHGPKKTSECFITGRTEVRVMQKYINAHPLEMREGRFWKKMVDDGPGRYKVHKSQIGANTIAKYAKEIAALVKLQNSSSFSGHSFRRSAISIAADIGCNPSEMQSFGDAILRRCSASPVTSLRQSCKAISTHPSRTRGQLPMVFPWTGSLQMEISVD
jgi:hypothetical protein